MRRVFYIQRLLKPVAVANPFSFGGGLKNGGLSSEAMSLLNPIFSFDYMGSAEFEFGAIPKAFEALNQIDLVHFTIQKEDKLIYVISPLEIKQDVIDWLANCEKESLKESLDLDLTTDNPQVLGWLKIENENGCKEPFMFFIDKEMFDKTCELLNSKE